VVCVFLVPQAFLHVLCPHGAGLHLLACWQLIGSLEQSRMLHLPVCWWMLVHLPVCWWTLVHLPVCWWMLVHLPVCWWTLTPASLLVDVCTPACLLVDAWPAWAGDVCEASSSWPCTQLLVRIYDAPWLVHGASCWFLVVALQLARSGIWDCMVTLCLALAFSSALG